VITDRHTNRQNRVHNHGWWWC